MTEFTVQNITQLAPDEASIKAARGLNNTSRWSLLAHNQNAVWGHCQGSGSKPYQTGIDLNGPAFRCSCPSRKFPCKHALALFWLYVEQRDSFQSDADLPEEMKQWLDKCHVAKENQAVRAEKKAIDPVAQQKRLDKRLKNVADGLADLQIWLNDLIRHGLVQLDASKYGRFRDMARRMVDAQMPAVAHYLQRLAELPSDRHQALLWGLSKLQLLIDAFQKYEHLSADWQAEILMRVGIPQSKEQVLNQVPVRDIWLNVGLTTTVLDKGESRTSWLYGIQTRRFAHLTEFVYQGKSQDGVSVLLGKAYEGDVYFYEGVENKRVLPSLTQWKQLDKMPLLPPEKESIAQAWKKAQHTFAQNPWVESVPILLESVHWRKKDQQWALSDGESAVILNLNEEQCMEVLAFCEDQPFNAVLLHHYETSTSCLMAVNRQTQWKVWENSYVV